MNVKRAYIVVILHRDLYMCMYTMRLYCAVTNILKLKYK